MTAESRTKNPQSEFDKAAVRERIPEEHREKAYILAEDLYYVGGIPHILPGKPQWRERLQNSDHANLHELIEGRGEHLSFDALHAVAEYVMEARDARYGQVVPEIVRSIAEQTVVIDLDRSTLDLTEVMETAHE